MFRLEKNILGRGEVCRRGFEAQEFVSGGLDGRFGRPKFVKTPFLKRYGSPWESFGGRHIENSSKFCARSRRSVRFVPDPSKWVETEGRLGVKNRRKTSPPAAAATARGTEGRGGHGMVRTAAAEQKGLGDPWLHGLL